jgi:retron-type reverse transcriptase
MGLLLGNTGDALESGNVRTKQRRIAELAELMPEAGFTSLAHYIDLGWLREAYRGVRKTGASGVDEVTAEEYEKDLEGNFRSLLERFKSGRYYAPPVKRVYIPKGDGKMRPIGIPVLEDKILQRAVVMVLNPWMRKTFWTFRTGFDLGDRCTMPWECCGNRPWRWVGAGCWKWTLRATSIRSITMSL